MDYQAIIVGAGPAGIFSALTLAEQGITPILLLELGK
jgi:thioredoxin reductase